MHLQIASLLSNQQSKNEKTQEKQQNVKLTKQEPADV